MLCCNQTSALCSRVAQSLCLMASKYNIGPQGYPFGPVVRMLDFHAGDLSSNPGRYNCNVHTVWLSFICSYTS